MSTFAAPARGIIPACAGSTSGRPSRERPWRDHPRMRGEHADKVNQQVVDMGSSPYARGAQAFGRKSSSPAGIIPACAGSTQGSHHGRLFPGDHPRMRGEHLGRSPEVGVLLGSSPHARGAPLRTRGRRAAAGIIPACAGSTLRRRPVGVGGGDHPRMRGEHAPVSISRTALLGSSPHARGARGLASDAIRADRIIPACAGSTRLPKTIAWHNWDHPRMRGEHLRAHHRTRPTPGSSPHARGARGTAWLVSAVRGIIPACAGSTLRLLTIWTTCWDHPRMRGEHPPFSLALKRK